MAFPGLGLEDFIKKNSKLAAMALVGMTLLVFASILVVAFVVIQKIRGEMMLCAKLIKQKEATRQGEQKSLNKSNAFAQASHDIRNDLTNIISLIELSYDDVPSGSKVEAHLRQMHARTDHLLDLLNTVLDASKIEAGKMELEHEEFNLAELLEDAADFYHPIAAMKNRVEVVLDPCDGSLQKFATVRGDRIKLKQILSNLLSNAVKFTNEGHISIRGWARRPTLETTLLASHHKSWLNCLSYLFPKNQEHKGLEDVTASQQNLDVMEYVIEVDDTGCGIFKEKRNSVFVDYIQIKDTSLGHGGTGLGLGIVQSLVRLMGGDICIVDKEPGENGTCFRFNVFLTASDLRSAPQDTVREGDIEAPVSSKRFVVPDILSRKADGSSLVVLFIRNKERRRVVKRFLEGLGVRVSVWKHWEYTEGHLKRLKRKILESQNSSTEKSDWSSESDCLSVKSLQHKSCKDNVPLSSLDELQDDVVSTTTLSKKIKKGTPTFFMFLIDIHEERFQEVQSMVEDFRRDISHVKSTVIWLENPAERNATNNDHFLDTLASQDLLISRPLHGSRLHQIVRMLPEFGGLKFRINGMKILVAEDCSTAAQVVCKCLTKLGALVELCRNGKEAVMFVVEGLNEIMPEGSSSRLHPFDLILMDCEMPEMSGFEAAKQIRKAERPYGIHIPIVALTAHTSKEKMQEIRSAGMDDHLAKPFNMKTLPDTISLICQRISFKVCG